MKERKKGFFGIGKKPDQYEAEIIQQAIVEIVYKEIKRVFPPFEIVSTKDPIEAVDVLFEQALKVAVHAPLTNPPGGSRVRRHLTHLNLREGERLPLKVTPMVTTDGYY